MEFIEYTTVTNDRWDLIAYKMYGDASLYEQIIRANPEVLVTPVLPPGLVLNIPVLEIKKELPLPSWMQ